MPQEVLLDNARALVDHHDATTREVRFNERLHAFADYRTLPPAAGLRGFFAKPKLLIVDELGYLSFETNAAHLFFQLISRRYERGSVLIASNRSVGEWGTVFGDAVVATAILDRWLHHSQVITILGDSYRLREKRRSGLIKPTPIDTAA